MRHAVLAGAVAAVLAMLAPLAALAQVGMAKPWQLGMQEAVTPVMESTNAFHNFILVIITAIVVLVLVLLVICMVRFNHRANPTPARTTHHTLLEVVWTIVPVLILVVIAIPSFRLLYHQLEIPEADFTVKAIGSQWYWSYEYPDHDDLSFDSLLLEDDTLAERREIDPQAPRLLAVDTPMVVPVNKTVRVIVTANDVLHNWAIPSFGVRIDAVPGRLNETWFRATQTGTFYGQCAELCGNRHAFMPIEVRVVTDEQFEAWLTAMRDEGPEEATRQVIAAMASAPKAVETAAVDEAR